MGDKKNWKEDKGKLKFSRNYVHENEFKEKEDRYESWKVKEEDLDEKEKKPGVFWFLMGMACVIALALIIVIGYAIWKNHVGPSTASSDSDENAATTSVIYDKYGHYETDYDDDGNKIAYRRYDICGPLVTESKYEYNNGVQTGYKRYSASGDLIEEGVTEQDQKGNIIKWNYYDGQGQLKRYREAELDKNGNAIKWTSFDADGTSKGWEEIEYDGKGKETKSVDYTADGKKEYSTFYNGDGDTIKSEGYDDSGNPSYTFEYEYYSKGQKKTESYTCEGNRKEKEVSRFDERGCLVEYISYRNQVIVERTEFEYDSEKRLIKQTDYKSENMVSVITVFEYNSQNYRTKAEKQLDDGTVFETAKYQYGSYGLISETIRNSKGKITKVAGYDDYGNESYNKYYSDGKLSFEYEYECSPDGVSKESTYISYSGEGYKETTKYDESGHNKEEIEYTLSGKKTGWTELKTDDQGRTREKYKYDANGKLLEKTVQEYRSSSSWQLTKSMTYDAAGNILHGYEYTYDNGDRTGYTSYGKGGHQDYRVQYEYDDLGNEIKSYSYDKNNQLSQWTESKYDECNECILETTYDNDGTVDSVYEYEYYSSGTKKKTTSTYSWSDGESNTTYYDVDGDPIE